MNKSLLLLIFIFLALIQIAVPGYLIFNKNQTISQGTVFKFKTLPIDPAEPFVGRYVDLRFDQDTFSSLDAKYYREDADVYVEITKGIDSFAIIKSIALEPSDFKEHYIKATVQYVSEGKVFIKYPFTRFYMEESKAPKADSYANQMLLDTLNFGYAEVAIFKGDAVIKDVKINDRTIKSL
ncbi:MAG: GDYXXLXY domain-containing protein [Saprospiraceae bacterium]|nr:GDYXXLXY domain-containing protein [Saprospiraceae bacterium]